MKKKFKFLLLVLTFTLLGCNIQPKPPLISSVTSSPSTQGGETTKSSPASSLPPTLEAIRVATATQSGSQKFKDLILSPCLPINTELPKGLTGIGDLLVVEGARPSVINLNSGVTTKVNVPDSQIPTHYFLSPDGKWVSYLNHSNTLLYVEPSGNLLEQDPKKRIAWGIYPWFELEGWFNSQTLIITRIKPGNTFYSTTIANPFNREMREFVLEDLPRYLNNKVFGVGLYLFQHSNLMPDPTLKRIVYPEVMGDSTYVTLWDLDVRKPLVKLNVNSGLFDVDPLWSQDGKDFLMPLIVPLQDGTDDVVEWFLVTRDGSIRRLTHFENFLEGKHIDLSSRSGDGGYLAFRLTYKSKTENWAKYIIMDLNSTDPKGFCIDTVSYIGGGLQVPVWSPDSRYLAISNTDVNSYGSLVIVDVEKRLAYQVAKDLDAVGWIAKP